MPQKGYPMEHSGAEISGADLAYLGDAVLEVMVRERLVLLGHGRDVPLSEKALLYVTARAQSEALSKIEGMLTEEEKAVFRRARNNFHTSNVPKSATPAQYRRSTGFEAIFGYLFLEKNTERLSELFDAAYSDE